MEDSGDQAVFDKMEDWGYIGLVGQYQKWFWRIGVIRPIGLLVHALYPYPVLLYVLQGQRLGQWTLFIAPCMQGESLAMGQVDISQILIQRE